MGFSLKKYFRRSVLKKPIQIMVIDDNLAVHNILSIVFSEYYGTHRTYNVDYFSSTDEFYSKRKRQYDIAIIDWNIGETIHDKGDSIVGALKGDCNCMTILSGQTNDKIDILKFTTQNNISFLEKTGSIVTTVTEYLQTCEWEL